MLINIWDSLTSFFQDNQFASGGLVLGIGTVVYRHSGAFLGKIRDFISKRLLITVRADRYNYGFEWMREWLGDALYKNNKLVHEFEIKAESRANKNSMSLSQSDGKWLMCPQGFRIFVAMDRVEEQTDFGTRVYNKMLITTGRWNRTKLIQLMTDIAEKYGSKESGKLYLANKDGTDWTLWCDIPKASIDHVVLDGSIKHDALLDIRKFLKSEGRYTELGLPYKRGYLLYGPPGNGKTSFIRALAHELGKSIALISGSDLATETTQHLIARSGNDKLIVIEDIDRSQVVNHDDQVTTDKAKEGETSQNIMLSFNGRSPVQNILNLLDGIQGGNGQIIICTANNPEKLDAAFLRPGRIDYKVKFNNASSKQVKDLFLRFYPGQDKMASAFADMIPNYQLSMAQAQQHFICYMNDPSGAVSNINQLLNSKTNIDAC